MTEAPTLGVLRRIQVNETTPYNFLMAEIAKANWNDRLTAADLIKEVVEGRISAWRVEGVESGLALVRIEESPTRRVLILDGLAGHNVLKMGRAIVQDLETIARFWGASSIETSAKDPRFQALSKRLGFDQVSVVYERKIV